MTAVRAFAAAAFVWVASGAAADGGGAGGRVRVDGSSTLFPLTEAVTEEFGVEVPGVRVPIGVSGTGGGFKKLCAKETDVAAASRPVKPEESAACAASGVAFVELPVATDAIVVVVHPSNDHVDRVTLDELRALWRPEAQGVVRTWKQVRDSWPDSPVRLFGPGTDSGTFDFFTLTVNGAAGSSRGDYTSSEDDNVVVQGVSRDTAALGYVGMAYAEGSGGKLKVVPVSGGAGTSVRPDPELVAAGLYKPLSRPLYLYVSVASVRRPEVRRYVTFYVDRAGDLAREVGLVPPDPAARAAASAALRRAADGS